GRIAYHQIETGGTDLGEGGVPIEHHRVAGQRLTIRLPERPAQRISLDETPTTPTRRHLWSGHVEPQRHFGDGDGQLRSIHTVKPPTGPDPRCPRLDARGAVRFAQGRATLHEKRPTAQRGIADGRGLSG